MLLNMNQLLKVANEKKFAVPAFNISSLPMLNGVVKTCEELNSPVILEIHPDELSYIGDSFVKTVLDKAYKTKIPVVVHLDHGSSLAQVVRAIQDGFTSVMIDGSRLSFEDNIELTKKVVDVAHLVDISVEAEIGTIGSDASDQYGGSRDITYTVPADAKRFIDETGCDTLAVAIGTAHGVYPKDFVPKLKLDLLSEIKELVKIPLVLHGGSSNPDAEISEAVNRGINKINISSDIKMAFHQKCREVLARSKSIREPNVIYPECTEAMCEVVKDKVCLFKANDKVKFY